MIILQVQSVETAPEVFAESLAINLFVNEEGKFEQKTVIISEKIYQKKKLYKIKNLQNYLNRSIINEGRIN